MLEQYQIGRGTLRESLRYLELQGLISLKPGPGGGPIVEKPSSLGLATAVSLLLQMEKAPYRNIVEARESLEPAMSRLAASRVSSEDLERLQANLDRMLAGIDDGEVFAETNQEFHDVIARASNNALFANMIDALTGILDGTAIGVEYPIRRRRAVHEAHTRIFEALQNRDPIESAETMREHIREYTRYIEAKYPDVIDAPISWT